MATPAPPGRSSWIRARLRLVIVVAAGLGIAGFVVSRRLQPIPVTATPVVRGKAVDAVYATGTVETYDRVNVKAKTNGSIAQILVKEGDRVKKGDLIARIDNPIVTFDLKRGQADLSAAAAQAGADSPQLAALRAQAKAVGADLETARTDLRRLEELAKTGAVTPSDLDRARARAAQLESNIAANEAQQRALRIDLNANAARQAAQVQSLATRVADTEVRSPLDGVVLARSVEIGQVVAVNETLFKVGETRDLVLEVSVDEADIARVHDGRDGAPASPAAVSLYAFPREVFRGRVFEVLPDANRERKAFLAKVRLDKAPPGLRSGMSAEVNIVSLEKEGALLAPSEAEASGAVWIVRGDRARRQKVSVGIRDLLRVEVVEGLGEGDLVVIEGQDKIAEGTRLRVTVRQPDKMAPMPDASQPARTSL